MVELLVALAGYLAPVSAPVAVPFDAPACTYCAGHRILEYDVPPGTRVVAVTAGVVIFAGVVVGTRYVTVRGDDGLRATYGMLAGIAVTTGSTVAAGELVGTTTEHFSLGVRDGETYVDPTPFIGVVSRRPRLVPPNGGRGRPPRTRPATCAATPSPVHAAGATAGSRR